MGSKDNPNSPSLSFDDVMITEAIRKAELAGVIQKSEYVAVLAANVQSEFLTSWLMTVGTRELSEVLAENGIYPDYITPEGEAFLEERQVSIYTTSPVQYTQLYPQLKTFVKESFRADIAQSSYELEETIGRINAQPTLQREQFANRLLAHYDLQYNAARSQFEIDPDDKERSPGMALPSTVQRFLNSSWK